MRIVFGILAVCGFILMMGVAGSDCDGKCMDNAMSITDMLIYGGLGIAMFATGVLGLVREGV